MIKFGHEKSEVLEETEHAQPHAKGGRHPSFSDPRLRARRNASRRNEIESGREKDEEEEAPVPAAIEEVARQKKEAVLQPVAEAMVGQEDHRQEKPEAEAVEPHVS